MPKPVLIADQYIERINLAISVSLGLYEASDIASRVHFIKYICGFVLIIGVTFYIQWYIENIKDKYNKLFFLFWRIVNKMVNFTQQFLTTITFNIIIQKFRENDSGNDSMKLTSRFMIYSVIFVFLTSVTVLFGWFFYEQPVYKNLPEDMIRDITKPLTKTEKIK